MDSTTPPPISFELPPETSHVIEIDIQALCRICGNFNEYLVSIFEDQGKQNELGPKINKYLPIKVGRFFLFFLK